MGQESTFIDLDGMLDDSELMEMERVANEVVWMDLPVEVSWPRMRTPCVQWHIAARRHWTVPCGT